MTNKEAYMFDLESLKKDIDRLQVLFPVGSTKVQVANREKAEEIIGNMRAVINCMERDYIPQE